MSLFVLFLYTVVSILVPLHISKISWNDSLFWFSNSYINWIFLLEEFNHAKTCSKQPFFTNANVSSSYLLLWEMLSVTVGIIFVSNSTMKIPARNTNKSHSNKNFLYFNKCRIWAILPEITKWYISHSRGRFSTYKKKINTCERYSKIRVPYKFRKIVETSKNSRTVIMKQDKGRGVVLMDTRVYLEKCLDM